MAESLRDLLELLDPEPIGKNIFRGQSRDIGTPQVFGGQVLGQALAAAGRTVEGRDVHSLHAYFLKAGDVRAPIIYEVERTRDGGSFSNRRIVAVQHGGQIFNMTASFQVAEPGLEHQAPMPEVPPPEALEDLESLARGVAGELPPRLQRVLAFKRPVQVRPVSPGQFLVRDMRDPVKHLWIRAAEPMPADALLQQALLAYVSDYELIGTATLPHGLHATRAGLQMASLDHAMWFHRPVQMDDWLLFALESPAASGGRGLARGHVFSRDGRLVATLAQEGLMRVRRDR